MSFFGLFTAKKDEVLKTDELRRKTKVATANKAAEVDEQFIHLSILVDATLRELGKGLNKKTPYHPSE